MTKKAQRTGDKWYALAKQQGYRARSAFKLIQLNRQFNFLSKAHVLIDLCAAPGGWCQVAAKQMPIESTIIGVDLLPIKPIHNVKTFQEDITTLSCRDVIKRELHGKHADVVLHDGAPNVGGGWSKDAFDQNSLVLHSLRLAVEFMTKGATFVTKVFRSADYHALIYIFNQLFEKVQATKPAASRTESAEIFVVCQNYKAPSYIDPKFLNPDYAFKQVGSPKQEVNLFGSKTTRKRSREGYDEDLGLGLKRVISVKDFMTRSDPIRVLSEAHELRFDEDSAAFLESPLTTEEVRACCSDLRVLNKNDFKMLLKWRLQMLKEKKELIRSMQHPSQQIEEIGETGETGETEEKEEEEAEKKSVESELQEVRERVALEKRREERKERKRLAKERKRRLLGMDKTPVMDLGDQVFSVTDLSRVEREELGDVDLNTTENPLDWIDREKEEEEEGEKEEDSDVDEMEVLQAQLDNLYENYKVRHAANEKRYLQELEKKKGLPAQKLRELHKLDELYQKEVEIKKEDLMKQAEEENENDEEDNDEEENQAMSETDESEDEPPKKSKSKSKKTARGKEDADSSDEEEEEDDDDDEASAALRRQRWFSDPLFASLNDAASDSSDEDAIAAMKSEARKSQKRPSSELPLADRLRAYNDEEDAELLAEAPKIDGSQIADGEYVPPLLDVPKSDKEKRHEKRVKRLEKERKKKEKEAKADLEIVETGFPQATSHLTEDQLARQAMIKAGLGSQTDDSAYGDLEVVKAKEPKIGSDEHLEALSLGFLLSKHSTANDLIDSSYNRYMFNDPAGLPEWFLEDERKYNRPQLPMTREIMEKLRKQFQNDDRTIKKEREALARKRRRVERFRKQQKAKIDSINNDEDMPDSAKLKAIQKLMKGKDLKRPGKTYVVGKKGAKGGRGVKVVDRRLKKDKRGEKRAAWRAKHHLKGKKGKK